MGGSDSARPRAGRTFLAAAVALLGVAALSAAAVRAYAIASAKADHTVEVRQEVAEWVHAVVDAETGVRGYVASGRTDFLAPYTSALPRERAQAALVRRLVAGESPQSERAERADREAHETMTHLTELVAMVKQGRREAALATLSNGENMRRMDAFRSDAAALREVEAHDLREQETLARAWARMAIVGSLVLTLLSCALLMLAWRRERAHDRSQRALADQALRRLEALSALAVALAEARTRAQVGEVIVEQGRRATGADTCTLFELDDDGEALDLVAERGVAPEVVEQIRHITEPHDEEPDGAGAILTNMKAGLSIWAEREEEYERLYPALAGTVAEEPRARAFWSVPLVAEGRSLGLLGAGYYQPRPFPPGERAFIETLSRHCAQAFLRAARLEREDQARLWLATTLRSIGDGVIATDAAGRVSFMNGIAEALTGFSEIEARGRPLADVFHILSEETREPVESPVGKVLRDGAVVGLANHTRLRSRQGVEIPIDDSGAPIRAPDGKVAGVVLVFRDATAERQARVQREFLARAGEALVASLDDAATLATVARLAVPTLADWCAIDLVEPGGTSSRQVAVAHVDPRKIRLARELGERYPPDPGATTGVPEVVRTGKSELYPMIPRELLERAAQDSDHARMIRELNLESGMVVPLRGRGRTLGAITFVYADSGRHYTEDDLSFAEDFARRAALAIENALALKEAEAGRLREQALRSEAELANRAKDQFLATVSHELRTPLTAIAGWVSLLRRRSPPPEVDRGLAVIERNARLQTKLIDDVLDISRIISGKLVLSVGTVKMQDIASAAIETVTPAATAKGIAIVNELPAEPIELSGDADRLQQVIWNLLANAVKFTPKGGRVTVRGGRQGSDVWVTVKDTGEGVRRALLPVLFEPFRQADASTTRHHGGLGLGLAIVRQIVLAHGGTVSADSEGEGRGATFTVRLPTRAVVPVISPAVTGTLAQTSPTPTSEDVARLDGVRLLLVDDEPDALDLLGEVLSEQGAEVHSATSAREALRAMPDVRPDVLVSDIGMPDMDGFALIEGVRALRADACARTPAIALTAFARPEDVRHALAAGFQMHIAKPVEIPQLVRAIATMSRHLPSAGTAP
jgi:PAS domain S-box-containing protein